MQDSVSFARRHLGAPEDHHAMLEALGFKSLDALVDAAVPAQIRLTQPLNVPAGASEQKTPTPLPPIIFAHKSWPSFIRHGLQPLINPPGHPRHHTSKTPP